LQILVKSYDALGMKELKADSQRILDRNYPGTTSTPSKKPSAWWKFW
jgi:outer membrane protein assembly factor BamD